MTADRARLGVEVRLDLPSANAGKALAELAARGGRAQAFELARALGVSLSALAPTLAWLEGRGLAACAAGWAITDKGLDHLRANGGEP
ncbi:MAG TPA: hypothetical protein VFS43_38245 [Polyangiaceae bacterium]|nr:hypothetical protein [Polyangiaceae bacterium]